MHFLTPRTQTSWDLSSWRTWDRTCAPVAHVVIEVVPSWNGFSSHVTSPTCRTPPTHSCRHKSSAAAWMEHKCGMSLQSCACVSVLSGDFCSQKATTLARRYQSRHSATSRPSAPSRFGRKTQARFQCLLVKIGSCSSAVGPDGRIKTPKGISLFDQGVLKLKKNSCKTS